MKRWLKKAGIFFSRGVEACQESEYDSCFIRKLLPSKLSTLWENVISYKRLREDSKNGIAENDTPCSSPMKQKFTCLNC